MAGDADEDGPVHHVEGEEDEGEAYPCISLYITWSVTPQSGWGSARREGGLVMMVMVVQLTLESLGFRLLMVFYLIKNRDIC